MAASRGSWPSSTAPTPGPTWHLALVSLRQTDQGERQVYLRLGSCNDKPHRAPPCLFPWRELVSPHPWGAKLGTGTACGSSFPSRNTEPGKGAQGHLDHPGDAKGCLHICPCRLPWLCLCVWVSVGPSVYAQCLSVLEEAWGAIICALGGVHSESHTENWAREGK